MRSRRWSSIPNLFPFYSSNPSLLWSKYENYLRKSLSRDPKKRIFHRINPIKRWAAQIFHGNLLLTQKTRFKSPKLNKKIGLWFELPRRSLWRLVISPSFDGLLASAAAKFGEAAVKTLGSDGGIGGAEREFQERKRGASRSCEGQIGKIKIFIGWHLGKLMGWAWAFICAGGRVARRGGRPGRQAPTGWWIGWKGWP